MKERQEDLDNKLENMRSENEALWGEVLSLRQKHNQQQKIVNKLIQFLSALLQPRGMKRSFARAAAGRNRHDMNKFYNQHNNFLQKSDIIQ